MKRKGSILVRLGLALMLILMLLSMTAVPAGAVAPSVALDKGFYKTGATANITVEITPGAPGGPYVAVDGLIQTIVVDVVTTNAKQGGVPTKVTLTETGLATNIYKGSVSIVKTLTDATMKTQVIGETGDTIMVDYDSNDDGDVLDATDTAAAGVDNTAPTLVITAPTFVGVGAAPVVDTAYVKSVTGENFFAVTATAADAPSGPASIAVSTDGGASFATAVGIPAATFNWILGADGTVSLKLKATDAAGNSAIYPDDYDNGGATAPVITVGAPNGTTATATVAAGVDTVFGTVDDVFTITAAGGGYTALPTVTASVGGCTTLPVITATIGGATSAVTALAVTTAGVGCTSAYTVTVAAPTMTQAVAGAVTFAANGIATIALGTAGAGYATAPVVTPSDDRGTGATATAAVAAGAVTGYTVTAAGTGYDSTIKIPFNTTGASTTQANAASVKVDNTKPSVTDAAASPAKAHRGTSTTITAKVADATAGIKAVTADTSAFAGGSTTAALMDDGVSPDKTAKDGIYTLKIANVGTTDGTMTVKLTAEDKSGNKETTVSATFDVVNDLVAPKVDAVTAEGTISGTSTVRTGDMVEIVATATDDLAATLTVTADVSKVTGVSTDTAVALTKVGTTTNYKATVAVGVALSTTAADNAKSVKVTAKDSAANSATGTVTVNIAGSISSYLLKLEKGWNLVSLPMSPASNSIVDTFTDFTHIGPPRGKTVPVRLGIQRVTAFFGEDNRWRDLIWTTQWSGTPGFGDTGLIGGQSYFVLSSTAVSVTIPLQEVSALDTPPTYSVPVGWSTVPYVSLGLVKADQLVKDYLKGLSTIALYKFDATAGVPIKLDVSTTSTDKVELGKGYWIYVDKAGVLVP